MGKKGKTSGGKAGSASGSAASKVVSSAAAAAPASTATAAKKTGGGGKDKADGSAASSASTPPAPSPQDEAIARDIVHFKQSVDDLTANLSSASLKEVELLSKFDAHLSGETSMPEEGIQAARDLYLDVAKVQLKLLAKYDVVKSCQLVLQQEGAEMKRKSAEMMEETGKALHQKDVLHALADELAKKKEVFLTENQAEKEKELEQRQALSESYMARITDLSKQLEERSVSRIAEARRSDALKDKLRVSLNRYMKEEDEFKRAMKACEDELERQNSLIPKKTPKSKPSDSEGASESAANADGDAVAEEEEEQEDEEDMAFRAEVEEEIKRTNEAKEHIVTLVATEKGLRSQLAEYADRFERFQEALNKSNELFGGFKVRMEELTGVIRSLERENAGLLEKERKSQELLSAMRAEHNGQLSDISRGEQQITRLQSLIQKLEQDNQGFRTVLQAGASGSASDIMTGILSS